MPIYPGRRRGTYRVTVSVSGQQHEEIVEGSRKDALEHEARMRIDLGARSRLKVRTAPSFFSFSTEDYGPHARAHLGANTWRARKYFVKTLVAHFGPYRLDELDAEAVDRFIRARLAAGLGRGSVNQELLAFRAMLRVARELGRPVANLHVKLLKATTRRVHCWSPAEVARLLDVATRKDEGIVPMLVLMLNTGLRKGEVIAAPWAWVDWRRAMLCVAPHERWSPKNGKPREIPLSDVLLATLERLPRSSRWLFPTPDGERRTRFPDKRFAAVVSAAKLTGGPHTTRHTYASMFLAAGGSLFELSTLLGHSSTRTTELYAHLMPEHLERTRNVVNVGPATGGAPGRRAVS